jgi:hypothetical protein
LQQPIARGTEVDKDATLALFGAGKAAWNAWAATMIERCRELAAAGTWQYEVESGYPGDIIPKNAETKAWMRDSVAHFEQHRFAETPDFRGFVFPGAAQFMSAVFARGARFGGARFFNGAASTARGSPPPPISQRSSSRRKARS